VVVKLGSNTSNAASNQVGDAWGFTGSFRGEDVCCLPWARWWRTVPRLIYVDAVAIPLSEKGSI